MRAAPPFLEAASRRAADCLARIVSWLGYTGSLKAPGPSQRSPNTHEAISRRVGGRPPLLTRAASVIQARGRECFLWWVERDGSGGRARHWPARLSDPTTTVGRVVVVGPSRVHGVLPPTLHYCFDGADCLLAVSDRVSKPSRSRELVKPMNLCAPATCDPHLVEQVRATALTDGSEQSHRRNCIARPPVFAANERRVGNGYPRRPVTPRRGAACLQPPLGVASLVLR